MKLSMKSLAALLMMLNGAVMASENVNTPENRQFLKQQETLSQQLREKPDTQLQAWAEQQVRANPLQHSDNRFSMNWSAGSRRLRKTNHSRAPCTLCPSPFRKRG